MVHRALIGRDFPLPASPMVFSILDFVRSRNQRQGSRVFSREVEFMKGFPVAFLANGVLQVTHGGIELTIPVLLIGMLSNYAHGTTC